MEGDEFMNSRFRKSKRIKKKKNFMNKIDKSILIKTFSSVICIVIFILLFKHIISIQSTKIAFENDMENFYQLNSEKLFSIDKITLYHSASAKQNSDIKKSFLLDIYQFTDISFYITNKKNIIIKEFYIDNISCIPTYENFNIAFVYKNPLEFGRLNNFNSTMSERINFRVLDTNNDTDFSQPYVYYNLSNPITLEYIHQKVVENFNVGIQNTSIEYNGKLLRTANVKLDKLSANLYFNINIVDINNHSYTCRVHIPINLNNNNYAIYNGELLENINTKNLYSFFRT